MKNKFKQAFTTSFLSITLLYSFLLNPLTLNANDKIGSKSIDDYQIMTENSPPLNYLEDKKLKGFSVDLLDIIFKNLKSKKNSPSIKLMEWDEAYNTVQNKPNTMLFAMAKTDERSSLFKWVGPIITSKISLIAKKEKKIKISTLKDLEKYHTGVVKSDVGESLYHFPNLT